jgi:uncharacterized protein YbjT (DUF2867 family)
MKYVITGSLGNISRPIVEKLVSAGHDVTVISSQPAKQAEIEALGAKAAIGSVEDVAFLTETFKGADAVYTMVPPTWTAPDWKAHIQKIGENYAQAIRGSGVKRVVNLSSMGAHMEEGCGPVSGIFRVEKALDSLENVDVLHLRPAFFYYNFLANVPMVKHMGIIGANYGEGTTIPMTDPADIAEVAASALLDRSFSGKSFRYIVSDQKTTHEVAATLGAAIGKPELPWVDFKDEDAIAGMVQAGLPEESARNYAEMGTALRSGEMAADLRNHADYAKGKVSLADFSKVFAGAFANS